MNYSMYTADKNLMLSIFLSILLETLLDFRSCWSPRKAWIKCVYSLKISSAVASRIRHLVVSVLFSDLIAFFSLLFWRFSRSLTCLSVLINVFSHFGEFLKDTHNWITVVSVLKHVNVKRRHTQWILILLSNWGNFLDFVSTLFSKPI